ncbi:MAG: hypothetical protein C5B50_18695 [Verrucomicrobia bacterium]|nr:MAG: hypothetical protein C5B50_18695 [Verrucomicrobiota bacterium]
MRFPSTFVFHFVLHFVAHFVERNRHANVVSHNQLFNWPCSKAVEDYRSPRRFATYECLGNSGRFWTAPVLWRFGL